MARAEDKDRQGQRRYQLIQLLLQFCVGSGGKAVPSVGTRSGQVTKPVFAFFLALGIRMRRDRKLKRAIRYVPLQRRWFFFFFLLPFRSIE